MKRILPCIIAFFVCFAQYTVAQVTYSSSQPTVSIKYFDKTVYYPDTTADNPIYVHITVSNNGTEPLRFKLADDRMFSVDFKAFNVKNNQLPQQENLLRKRTTSQTVYFREISLETGEEYSFVENLKDYVVITDPGIYYFDVQFFPELYKSKNNFVVSNRLTLDIRPSPDVAVSVLATDTKTTAILVPEQLSPDKVVEQTIIARQRSLWDQYFLYMDIEQMLLRDSVRERKYRTASADARNRMILNYKMDLMQSRIDTDIVAIPESFSIEKTTYNQTEGSVIVIETFKYDTFKEIKRYEYFVRQRDGIWQIYNYRVENLGTE